MIGNRMEKRDNYINLHDLFMIWIVAVSLAAVTLLSLHHYKSLHALTVGSLLMVSVAAAKYRGKISCRIPAINIWLILVLLLALGLRAQPFLWVMGGQDQGLYVSMSEHYEKYGTPFVKDKVRAALSEDARKDYDRTQHYLDSFQGGKSYPTVDIEGMKKSGTYNLNVKHNNPYAMHTSAVFLKDMSSSEYVFQFYPLHPLWMAICAKLFGSDSRVYATTLFSLLSIVSFYLLARELTGGSRIAGLFIAAMLACNPLHAFFSKFPVTEIQTLFFSSTGFYYLARYYNQSMRSIYRPDYLLISAALFLCMFVTRISGFLYLPVFYFILLAVIWREGDDRKRARQLLWYSIAIMALYTGSIGYGLLVSYPYSMNVYTGIFSWVFGSDWLLVIAGIICVVVAVAVTAHLFRNNVIANKYVNHESLIKSGSYFLCLAFAVALIRMSLKLYGHDSSQLGSYSLVATVLYICPLSFVFIYNAVKKNSCSQNPFHAALVVFWTFFYGSTILTGQLLPYQFYYARYLLTEIVPYGLLLVALYWSALWGKGGRPKRLVAGVFSVTCLYFLFFSSFQLRGVEADGAAQALQLIKDKVKGTDVLLLGFDDLRLQTSLSYYYDINSYRADRPQTVNEVIYPELKRKFSTLYLLTKAPVKDQSVKLVSEVNYREGEFEHVNRIPVKFSYVNQCTLYLYEIDKKADTRSVYSLLENNLIWPR